MQFAKFGLTYRQIKAALAQKHDIKVSTSTVRRDVESCLKNARERASRNSDILLNLQMERLEDLMKSHWVDARKGDTKAAGVVMAAMDRMNRLMGIEAPKRVQLDAPDDANPIPVKQDISLEIDLSSLSKEDIQNLEAVLGRVR